MCEFTGRVSDKSWRENPASMDMLLEFQDSFANLLLSVFLSGCMLDNIFGGVLQAAFLPHIFKNHQIVTDLFTAVMHVIVKAYVSLCVSVCSFMAGSYQCTQCLWSWARILRCTRSGSCPPCSHSGRSCRCQAWFCTRSGLPRRHAEEGNERYSESGWVGGQEWRNSEEKPK